MKNSQHFDRVATYPVGHQAPRLGDDQFAFAWHSIWTTKPRLVSQHRHRRHHSLNNQARRVDIILGYVGGFFVEVLRRLA